MNKRFRIASSETLLQRLCILLTVAITLLVCLPPMGQLPIWNGEQPGHRNQYELITEAFLDGHIDFAYGDEANLEGLENPYDPEERKEAGVYYHWDHAYYKGHYYMYFGVVPVFLAFLPYRVITGQALTTYHATQLFAALAIVGIFVLFRMLSKVFFPKLPFYLYLAFSAAFSVMSIWYSCAEPALYCTPITCAIALEIWSLYFFIRGVYLEKKENRQILFAGIGALLGALVFGCRPPIALANILVLPMLYVFLKNRKFSWRLLGKLALAALPYVLVGIGLMVYNYARFEDPFEFGQTYQLTVADQTNYRVSLDFPTWIRLINNTVSNFFEFWGLTEEFPYLQAGGVFFNFPVLLLSAGLLFPPVWKQARNNQLLPLFLGLLVTVLVITAADILWTPYLLERYRMDIYFLMGIGCFMTVGLGYACVSVKKKRLADITLIACAAVTILSAYLLYVDTVGVYYPGRVLEIAEKLHLN